MKRDRCTGPPPTIGHDRQLGVVRVRIWCESPTCRHSDAIDLDVIALPDDVAIVDIPRHRNFVCRRCGGHEVSARAEFPAACGTAGHKHRIEDETAMWKLHTRNQNVSPAVESWSEHPSREAALRRACEDLRQPHVEVLRIEGPGEKIDLPKIKDWCAKNRG